MHRPLSSSDAASNCQGIIPTVRLAPEVGMGIRTQAAHSRCTVTWRHLGIYTYLYVWKQTSYVFSNNTLSYMNIYIGIIYYDTKATRTI